MWGFEDAVTCDSLPDMGALGSGFWAGVSDCHALVTPMWGDEDRRYLLWLHNGGEGPQKRRVESWPLSSTHIYHIFHQNLRLASLKKISVHCGLEGSLKSTSF